MLTPLHGVSRFGSGSFLKRLKKRLTFEIRGRILLLHRQPVRGLCCWPVGVATGEKRD